MPICVICLDLFDKRVPATKMCGELLKPLCVEHASFCKEDGHEALPLETEAEESKVFKDKS